MTKYKLQYWLYAILNKEFGREVKFHRDSLHRMYEVNRHSFEVSTNTMPIATVKKWFIEKLRQSGYLNSKANPDYYIKEVDGKEYTIVLHEQKHGLDYVNSNKPVIIVSVYAHTFTRRK